MADPFSDDVPFWTQQMTEHIFFIGLGLVDVELKEKADLLQEKWVVLRENGNNLEQLKPLMVETGNFKREILGYLNQGEWIGWLYPSFLEHVIKEYNYFDNRLQGKKLSSPDEILFWNDINKEHIEMARQMLDPKATELIKIAQKFIDNYNTIPPPDSDLIPLIILSGRLNMELGEYQKEFRDLGASGQKNTILHPMIADHMIRENTRGLNIISQLLENK